MHAANASAECRACSARAECAPAAMLLLALLHALHGRLPPPPDHLGLRARGSFAAEAVHDEAAQSRFRLSFLEAAGRRARAEEPPSPAYDFIVVGGGTAGCVLASRLSQNKDWKVLLLEAGPEEPSVASIPSMASELRGSSIDWQYTMRPKRGFCQARGERGCAAHAGRALGGSSVLNDMAYMRGSPADYDDWARRGNRGWAFSQLLPYFKYSEGNYDRDIAKNKYYHSTQGPLDVGRYRHVDDNVDILLSALNEMGYNYTDVNGRSQLGFTRVQTMSYFGERVSTYTAFLDPVRETRRNLDITTEALVIKILLKQKNDDVTALGVEYLKNGTKYRALVNKEVIVSAGAINSPKLLMQSGIGPAEYLEYLGVPVFVDLSVGANFHDHVSVCLPIIKLGNRSTDTTFEEKIKHITQYYKTKEGPLAANYQVIALLESSISDAIGTPDVELRFRGHQSDLYYNKMDICISLLTPNSRGQILLNATDPVFGKPLIYPNFLNDPSDERKILEGIKESVKLFDTDAFKSSEFEFDPGPLLDNECRAAERVTEDFWLCLMRHFSSPLNNYAGSCKMGPPGDRAAVVDPTLRVHGTTGLRVVDASIMPKVVRGSTAAPVIMIAEKASDLIKSTWYKMFLFTIIIIQLPN